MRKSIAFMMLLFCCLVSWAQLMAQQPESLPIDPKVRYGTLKNGMTYYIRHNEQPKERADFYIAQNVGSILEEENQRGLAHFLEHMAFDGSKHFPNNGMDAFIERVGMRSGENFNAYTSFDETVYMITNAPVQKEGVVDSCLLILHDWSGCLSLTDSAIRKERGVIREEWRTRQDAQMRLWEQQLPALFPGSRYANRMPIGTIEVIENFRPEELRAYYKKWYRPDLQALIIVGDIDVEQVEATIHRMFADIPAPVNPAERWQEPVPDNEQPLISIATDKEASNTILQLFYKHDNLPPALENTTAGVVKDYIQQICAQIMDERFTELLQQANPPFIYAQAYDDDHFMVAKGKGAWSVAALAKEGEIDSTLSTLVRETQRVKQHGFTPSEYERARIHLLKLYESAFNEREHQKNDAYTREYVHHFTEGGYIPGIEVEYALMNEIAAQIPLEQINQYIQGIIGDRNVVISLTGPDKSGLRYPTKEELAQLYEQALQLPIEAYRETLSNEPLISQLPTPGQIVGRETDARLGTTILTLSNGIKVVLKPTPFKKDEILMTASRPGGSSLFGTEDIENLKIFNEVIELGGLGNFSAIELDKRLAGKKVSCTLSLSADSELVNGMAGPEDLQTLFELIYLGFTAPRIDNEAFASFENRVKAQLPNLELNPMVAFSDTMEQAIYGDNPRNRRLRMQDFGKISYARIMEMRQACFSNASDFVFTFVGNVNLEQICPYLEQYLATLPTAGKATPANLANVPAMRKGTSHYHFQRTMEVPKVTVAQIIHGQMTYDLENLIVATAWKQILDLLFYDQVREKEGGTYGVNVHAGISSFPEGRTTLQIYFDTDPAKWKEMNAIIHYELERMAEEGPSLAYFQKTQDNLLKRHAEQIQENSYWLSTLATYYEKGMDRHTDYEAIVKGLTTDKIRAFAQRLLDQGNWVEVVMIP